MHYLSLLTGQVVHSFIALYEGVLGLIWVLHDPLKVAEGDSKAGIRPTSTKPPPLLSVATSPSKERKRESKHGCRDSSMSGVHTSHVEGQSLIPSAIRSPKHY